MIELYQFQFSHFCEKACWALDYKRLPYTRKNLLPGLHLRTAKNLAGRSSLPILIHHGEVVQDSTTIINFLDKKYDDHPLTPREAAEAKAALEWEEYLDEEIGVPLRLWFYFHTLPDRDRALKFLLDGAPWYGRPLFALIYPKVRDVMKAYMNIHAESARQAEVRFIAALDRLDGAIARRRFLVGDRFSRADLTACALLRPYCMPEQSDAEIGAALPAPVHALREAHKARPFVDWVRSVYAEHRR